MTNTKNSTNETTPNYKLIIKAKDPLYAAIMLAEENREKGLSEKQESDC